MKKEYDLKKMKVAGRGPVCDPKDAKITKTIRLDGDIVAWLLRESDRRRIPYQTIINTLLKEAMDRSMEDAKKELREMIQEEVESALAKLKTG
jgi:uncharacterized protein (DUF4415 family)